jgi:hypothetical protein
MLAMRKAGRGPMYHYTSMFRGQQVEAELPAGVGSVTVQVTGDRGVLDAIGRTKTPTGGTLIRFAVSDRGSARIEAHTLTQPSAIYVAGVTAAC